MEWEPERLKSETKVYLRLVPRKSVIGKKTDLLGRLVCGIIAYQMARSFRPSIRRKVIDTNDPPVPAENRCLLQIL